MNHCVFMGMGEPMLNLDAVLEACTRLPDVGVTHRRTAISTVGWIPGIQRFIESDLPVRLALSLHAADDALRSEIMPVNERYPLADVLAACRAYHERRRRKVFVEYVMLAGVNDRVEQAMQLADLLDPDDLQGEPDSRTTRPAPTRARPRRLSLPSRPSSNGPGSRRPSA